MTQLLKGQVALVTGGGRGIGRAIAEKLAAEGAAVAITSRSEDRLSEVVEAIESKGGKAFKVVCDVTDSESVNNAIQATEDTLGPITFLVNNAGQAGPYGPVGELNPEEWWDAVTLHIRAPMLFMSTMIPAMKKRGGGRVLNVCSKGGVLIAEAFSAYGVGKCGAIRLTEFADLESKAGGVRAFAIQPGTIVTELAKGTINSPEAKKHVPWMIDLLKQISTEQSDFEMQRCVRYVAEIAAGLHDDLGGHYVDFDDDLEELKEKFRKEQEALAAAQPS